MVGGPRSYSPATRCGDHPVEREHAARPGEDERDPGEDEDDVGSRVVGRRVKAHSEEEREREHHPAGCGDSRPQSENRSQTYRQFGQGDDDADGNGEAQEVSEQFVQGADPDGCDQLGLDARGAVRVEEVRIGQLLEPGKAKSDAQEGTQGHERPPREGQGPRRRGIEADTPSASAGSVGSLRSLVWHLLASFVVTRRLSSLSNRCPERRGHTSARRHRVPDLHVAHPGRRRHRAPGARRSAGKTHPSRRGDQITVCPRFRPRTMSEATCSGPDGERCGGPASRHLGAHKARADDVDGDTGATKGFGESDSETIEAGLRGAVDESWSGGPGIRPRMTARRCDRDPAGAAGPPPPTAPQQAR